MNVSLVLVQEDGRQQDVALRKPVQVIGRQTDVAIRIPSSAVSRHHCEVSVSNGQVSVKDLGSSNGTFVNRRRITQAALKPGDLLCVGDKVFVVRVNGIPEDIDAEEAFDDGFVPLAVSGTGAAAPAQRPTAPAGKSSPSGDSTGLTPAPTRAPTRAPTPATSGPAKAQPKAPDAGSKTPSDLDDSSVADFDFLDEDEDMKKQPKL